MKRVLAPLVGVLLLCAFVWLAQSGIIQWLGDFFAWYINFQVTTNDLNNTFVLIGKILTWVVSYGAVGIIFNFLGWFNSKAMSITYNVISFILNIILTLILKFIQDYAVTIVIALIVITIVLVITWIIMTIKNSKKGEATNA